VCDEGDYGTSTESDFEDYCAYEQGTYANGACTDVNEGDYNLTDDSITISLNETLVIPESYASMCVAEGGTYANGVCTISADRTMAIVIDGNTATLTYTEIDEDYPEYSYCEVTVLTKQ